MDPISAIIGYLIGKLMELALFIASMLAPLSPALQDPAALSLLVTGIMLILASLRLRWSWMFFAGVNCILIVVFWDNVKWVYEEAQEVFGSPLAALAVVVLAGFVGISFVKTVILGKR